MDVKKIYEAQERLRGNIRKTPITKAKNLGDNVFLKVEVLQETGSFKLRGAFNKIATLTEEEKKHGVIACSAGNHAQGVAKSATEKGIESLICMPYSAPLSKIQATKNYGAKVMLVKDSFDDAAKKAEELVREEGYTFIPPFDDEEIIAGQGTIGLEILEEINDIDMIIVPIGGGGLISGIALAAKSINKDIKIIGVQTEIAPSMYESIKEDKILTVKGGSTIADGIAVKKTGSITFEMVREYVDDIVLVSETEISSAILKLLEENKIIAEGAGATPVAAIMYDKIDIKDKKVCCVISGGNIDVTRISKVIEKGLYKSNRTMNLSVSVADNPGAFLGLAKIFEKYHVNIIKVEQKVDVISTGIDIMIIDFVLSTRNKEHQQKILKVLREKGYEVQVKYED